MTDQLYAYASRPHHCARPMSFHGSLTMKRNNSIIQRFRCPLCFHCVSLRLNFDGTLYSEKRKEPTVMLDCGNRLARVGNFALAAMMGLTT